MRISLYLMTDSGTQTNWTADAVRGVGYYGISGGLSTIAIYTNNLTGRIYIDATLVDEPDDDDWFVVPLAADEDYLEFDAETEVTSINVTGNFLFMRARLDRSYVINPPMDVGNVRKILLNY